MRVRERDEDVGSERVVGIRVTRLQHWSGFFFWVMVMSLWFFLMICVS